MHGRERCVDNLNGVKPHLHIQMPMRGLGFNQVYGFGSACTGTSLLFRFSTLRFPFSVCGSSFSALGAPAGHHHFSFEYKVAGVMTLPARTVIKLQASIAS